MNKGKWKWFGNVGHLIVGSSCRFHLCTQVGKYLISTVGQWWPERIAREIHAEVHDHTWLIKNKHLMGDEFDRAYMKKFGYSEIGCDRTFETMVFKAGKPCRDKECGCGLPAIDSSSIDYNGYSNTKDATDGHLKMCRKFERKKK